MSQKNRIDNRAAEVGRRVRARRLESAISQTELADKIGVTFQQVQRYEKGIIRIGAVRLQRIAEALEVPVDFFFSDAPKNRQDYPESLSQMLNSGAVRVVKAYLQIVSREARQSLIEYAEKLLADQNQGFSDRAGPAQPSRRDHRDKKSAPHRDRLSSIGVDASDAIASRSRLPKGNVRKLTSEVDARVAVLRKEARADGQPFNEASVKDCRLFLGASPVIKKPSIYLIDNGNLRAVWRNADGAHLGLQFLGGGEVQFVIFARRAEAPGIARSAGRDSFAGIGKQIASFELHELVYT